MDASSRRSLKFALPVLVAMANAVCFAQPSQELREDAPAPAPLKSYATPAMEILGFDFLLNRYNHRFSGVSDYDVSLESIRRNLRSSWVVDSDPFSINQLGHPYQGSMYHGFARSSGLNYWESLGLTFVGSAGWEIAGENTRPSRNDQVASGIGGSFLGESLYRMANLLLEHGGGVARPFREVGAAIISPSNGFNRLVYGKGMGMIFDSHQPAYYSRLQLGVMGTARNESGLSTVVKRNELQADFSLEYGLPGKPGYQYRRPFDYFTFQATASSANTFESLMTRGLLLGRDYGSDNYRGIWGLYGSYDYISPQTFRISTTAVSVGTTGQWRANDKVVVQGTALAGVGYSAVGTVNGSSDQDYHYGVTPQALLALRVIHSNRASLDVTGREYFVSRAASGPGGHDNIARADIGLTVRITGLHAVTLKYLWNRRDATSTALGDRSQTRGTVGIFYTLLGHDQFGAVDWR
ncbi:MAG: hypothetical protein JWQ07_2972 [Ramlibacter sp.]|nr:hypothetical protein [Ramlibacter sp.]